MCIQVRKSVLVVQGPFHIPLLFLHERYLSKQACYKAFHHSERLLSDSDIYPQFAICEFRILLLVLIVF